MTPGSWADFATALQDAAEDAEREDVPEGLVLAAAERLEDLAAALPPADQADPADVQRARDWLARVQAAVKQAHAAAGSDLRRLDGTRKAIDAYGGDRLGGGHFIDTRR